MQLLAPRNRQDSHLLPRPEDLRREYIVVRRGLGGDSLRDYALRDRS